MNYIGSGDRAWDGTGAYVKGTAMSNSFIYVLPADKAFLCRNCKKEPQFAYKFPSGITGISKLCSSCVVKAMDKVNLEMDLAEEMATNGTERTD